MPITATFPTMGFPHRGIVSRDDFVLAQEIAQDTLAGTYTTNLNLLASQATTLAITVNAAETAAVAAANSASDSALSAQGSANYQGTWSSKGYTLGQTVSDTNGIRWLCKLTHTTAQTAIEGTYWTIAIPYIGAIGNINVPLLDMPLKNSLAMKSGVGSATFTRASTATYIDRYGVLQNSAVDTPRFEKEGYLNEGSSTNLLLYSEQFDNAYWTKESSTATANTIATLDPYGTNSAEMIMETAVNSSHALYTSYNTFSFTAGTTYTQSWFIKPNGRNIFRITSWTSSAFTAEKVVLVNLLTKTVSVYYGNVTNYKLDTLANGWFRVQLSYVADATGTGYGAMLRPRLDDGVTENYLGDVTKGFYIYGAQLEALPFASSYIPTVASTVTRAVDILNITSAGNFPSVYKSRSILADFDTKGKFGVDWNSIIAINSSNDGVLIFGYGSGYDFHAHGGKNTNMLAAVDIPFDIVTKRVCAVSNSISNSSSIYKDGVLLVTNSVPQQFNDLVDNSTSSLQIGRLWYGHISNLRIYDRALTAYEASLA